MDLKLYDTLTREKRLFTPLDPARVRMYVCGPTVYDFAHIGNARPAIVFDVLFRLLRHLYGVDHVTYVRNITDVDDKINARAAEEYPNLPLNEAISEVTKKTEKQYHEDVDALGCLRPTVEPRATEHIGEMRELIERLVAAGNAYVAEGHVLFSVPSMQDYGRLSKRSLDEMIAGARVDVAPYKRDPMDFVLWKPSKPGEPAWPSPAGINTAGRPGWHIECSAMSWKHLGETFDIHGGGIDLVFPHHENEIAQSRCSFHTPVMANYWMHNGFLQVEGEKMSKSLGNFVTIDELLADEKFGGHSWPGEVLRFAMLKTHYRQPIDWTVKSLEESYKELQIWANALANTAGMYFSIGQRGLGKAPQPAEEIVAALSDDLNTPMMLTELRGIFSRLRDGDAAASALLIESCEFLGLLRADKLFAYNQYHVGSGGKLVPPKLRRDLDEVQVAIANGNERRKLQLIKKLLANGVNVDAHENGSIGYEVVGDASNIEELIDARITARKAKNFKESDRIRDELKSMGIELEDKQDGTTIWKVKR
jgi:cysteinyl-tRNA synthetase